MMLSHGCYKVQLNEARRQNTVYMLVINESAVCDVYLCDTSKRSALAIEGFTCFFFVGRRFPMHFPPLRWCYGQIWMTWVLMSCIKLCTMSRSTHWEHLYSIRIYTVLYYEVLACQRTFLKLFSSLASKSKTLKTAVLNRWINTESYHK